MHHGCLICRQLLDRRCDLWGDSCRRRGGRIGLPERADACGCGRCRMRDGGSGFVRATVVGILIR